MGRSPPQKVARRYEEGVKRGTTMAPEAYKEWINKSPSGNHSVVAVGTGLNNHPSTAEGIVAECVARDCAVLLFSMTHDYKQNKRMTPEMLLEMMADVREQATKHARDAGIDNRVLITDSLPGLMTQLDDGSDWNRIVSHGPPFEVGSFYRHPLTRSALRGLERLRIPVYSWNENWPGKDYFAQSRMYQFVPAATYNATLVSKDRLQESGIRKDSPPALVISDPRDTVSCHKGTRDLMNRSDLPNEWGFMPVARDPEEHADPINHHDTTDPTMLGKWAGKVNRARNGFLKLLKRPLRNPQQLSFPSLHRAT